MCRQGTELGDRLRREEGRAELVGVHPGQRNEALWFWNHTRNPIEHCRMLKY